MIFLLFHFLNHSSSYTPTFLTILRYFYFFNELFFKLIILYSFSFSDSLRFLILVIPASLLSHYSFLFQPIPFVSSVISAYFYVIPASSFVSFQLPLMLFPLYFLSFPFSFPSFPRRRESRNKRISPQEKRQVFLFLRILS